MKTMRTYKAAGTEEAQSTDEGRQNAQETSSVG